MKKATGWVTCAAFAGIILFAMANNAQGVLLTSFIDAFHLESGRQGLPNAAANTGMLIAMLLTIPAAARVGKTRLFALGMGLMALMLALAGASGGAMWLVAAYLVMGLAFGFIDTIASALVSDLHQGKRASMLMGMLHAAYGTGGILAPILMTAAMGAGATWRTVLWALAGVSGAACAFCAVVFARHGKRLPESVQPPSRLSGADLARFAKRPGNLLILFCSVCYAAHQCSISLWINRIISVRYGNVALGAAAMSLFWVGTVASRLIVPMLRVTTVRYLRAGMLLAGIVVLLGVLVGGAPALAVSVAVAGLLSGASIPMTLSEVTRRNLDLSMLSITAVLLVTSVTAMVCAPLIGFIVGKTSLLAGLVFSGVAAVCASAGAFGVKEEKAEEVAARTVS